MIRTFRIAAVAALTIGMAVTSEAQGRRGGGPPTSPPRPGTVERVAVRDHEVVVCLPPSYAADPMRRFPATYFLAEHPADNLKVPDAGNKLAAAQGFSEQIVVLVNMSPGLDMEKFVAEELVPYVDGRYRTIAARISRGLGGEASGGASALRIAMKRPDVFSSLYLMSASVADAPAASLQRYYAIAVEVGTKDPQLAASRQLHEAMTQLGLPHYYEEYDGAYVDAVGRRVETRVLPFFSRNLGAPANPTSPAVQ